MTHSSTSERIGVVLMSYGSPRSLDDVESYYTDIRGGRAPTAEQLGQLVERYRAIGGTTHLAERTAAQAARLQEALEDREPGRWTVVLGTKHSTPTIESAVEQLAQAGVQRVVALVLAPHYSAASVGQYHARAGAAAAGHGLVLTPIDSWATEPAYVRFLAHQLEVVRAAMPLKTKVLFTAHSLPLRAVASGDPYADEVRATATAVAQQAGLAPWSGWSVGWQSAGRTTEQWLGPDVGEVIDDLSSSDGADGIVVCPCGFVSDHLEVLYDLDIEARQRAEQRGLAFGRTATVNDDPDVLSALAERVREAIA